MPTAAEPTGASDSSAVADVASLLRDAGCVFAEAEAAVLARAAGSSAELTAMARWRAAGAPLEQVVGWAEFCGLRVTVGDGVFVPRRRTEFLARVAVDQLRRSSGSPAVAVELCCGVAAVSAVLLSSVPRVHLHAVDLDPRAVRDAETNLRGLGGRVSVGDLYGPLPRGLRGRVDLVVANPPYVPSLEMGVLPREAREHEPAQALEGGPDGLGVVRRIAAGAPEWLAPGGGLVIEVSARQVPAARSILRSVDLAAGSRMNRGLGAHVVVGSKRRGGGT